VATKPTEIRGKIKIKMVENSKYHENPIDRR
jgi:hypothetical protein